jgi:transposase
MARMSKTCRDARAMWPIASGWPSCSRSTAAVANVATARKLALLFYNTMRYGMDYVEEGLKRYEAKYRERTLHNLQRAARNLGMTLIPLSPANA